MRQSSLRCFARAYLRAGLRPCQRSAVTNEESHNHGANTKPVAHSKRTRWIEHDEQLLSFFLQGKLETAPRLPHKLARPVSVTSCNQWGIRICVQLADDA